MARKPVLRRAADAGESAREPRSAPRQGPPPRRREPGAEYVADPATGQPAPPPRSTHESSLRGLEAIAAMGSDEFAQLMGNTGGTRLPSVGEQVRGTVTHLGPETALIDLGGKFEAWIPRNELSETDTVGSVVEAMVLRADEAGVRLSRQLGGQDAGEFLFEAHEANLTLEGKVTDRNKGGYVVVFGKSRAFCPTGHIDRVPGADLDRFVGQTLEFRVIEVEPRAVVSRRVLQEEALATQVAEFWRTVREGSEHQARVTGIKPHGIYVDIDGVNAMVPRSEITWEEVEDPTATVTRGQQVKVRLIDVDRAKERLTASIRATQPLGDTSSSSGGLDFGAGAFAAAFATAKKKKR